MCNFSVLLLTVRDLLSLGIKSSKQPLIRSIRHILIRSSTDLLIILIRLIFQPSPNPLLIHNHIRFIPWNLMQCPSDRSKRFQTVYAFSVLIFGLVLYIIDLMSFSSVSSSVCSFFFTVRFIVDSSIE